MNKLTIFWHKLPKWSKNKYGLSICFFVVWLTFFDEYNLLFQRKIAQEKKELLKDLYQLKYKSYQNQQFIESLQNPDFLERYAREQFLMKKVNEDVYIVE